MPKISVNNVFVSLSCHYGFTNCFEILNFVFSNIAPRRVSTCKILTFQDQYFHKYKAQKIVKFSFVAFLADFFFSKLYPQNLWQSENVPIKCPEQLLHHTEVICRRSCAKNFKSEFQRVERLDQMGFGVRNIQKSKKFFAEKIFFFAFLSRHYGFMNRFQILLFFFSIIR